MTLVSAAVLLFFAAPFIGLAYIIALPLVGLGAFAVLASRVAAKNETLRNIGAALKTISMVFAAPVIGLAYIVLFPFLGLATLVWLAGRAVAGRFKA